MRTVIVQKSSAKAASYGTRPFRVVLCHLPQNGPHFRWVTWLETTDSTPDRFWGHYHDSELQARHDYLYRCSKYGLEPTTLR